MVHTKHENPHQVAFNEALSSYVARLGRVRLGWLTIFKNPDETFLKPTQTILERFEKSKMDRYENDIGKRNSRKHRLE